MASFAQLLFHIPADVLPLRCVLSSPVWDTPDLSSVRSNAAEPADGHGAAHAATASQPPLGCGLGGRGGAPGGPAGHLFYTTGYTGRLKVWDDRDVSRPLLERVAHRSYVHDACWTRGPATIAVAMANCGCLWTVAFMPRLHMVLYGGVDGIAAAMAWEFPVDSRNRRPHVPLAGLVRDGANMRLLGPDDLSGLQLMHPGGPNWRAQEAPSRQRPANILPDVRQQLYVIRAGYGIVPSDGGGVQRPAGVAQKRARWMEDEGGDAGGRGVGHGGRRGGRGKRGRGPGSSGSGSIYEEGGAQVVGADGGPVWVLMGWQCGVIRFMRLSTELS
ncbi:hypothetical protein GPECTOR_14g59 [Gonium pectorale]|uniref:Uncharacterized protein n=1 Tax=Gonium pectorale TaxID=33097 RepID=A0A150GMP9_GONPE|nr:hypothetical protein GPECTOR_14g59 [Gonium pectorale]|eukprot:KXZ51074.1 hypothetical protein GPECTOR_14g59 [Gonium pectorale]